MLNKRELTAPCGLDCFNCELFETNLTDDLAEMIHQRFNVPKAEIPCKGCRVQDGDHYHLTGGCATLDCVKSKEVEFCSDCEGFPCSLLAPLAEGASTYPHNFKVYNLCRIKGIGFDAWAKESGEIRKRYFTQKFVVGKGQAD